MKHIVPTGVRRAANIMIGRSQILQIGNFAIGAWRETCGYLSMPWLLANGATANSTMLGALARRGTLGPSRPIH